MISSPPPSAHHPVCPASFQSCHNLHRSLLRLAIILAPTSALCCVSIVYRIPRPGLTTRSATRLRCGYNDGLEVSPYAFPKHQPDIRLFTLHRLSNFSETLQITYTFLHVSSKDMSRNARAYFARSSSDNSNYLQPPLHSPLVSSPSDIADPSPIAPSSNGTDFDDNALEPEDVGLDSQQQHKQQDSPSATEDLEATPSLKQGELTELKVLDLRMTQAQLKRAYLHGFSSTPKPQP